MLLMLNLKLRCIHSGKLHFEKVIFVDFASVSANKNANILNVFETVVLTSLWVFDWYVYFSFILNIFWQLLILIERIAKKKIGFYCWKIFIFDYFHVYEVSFQKFLSNLKHNNCLNFRFFLFRYWYWWRLSFSRLSKCLFSIKINFGYHN